MGTKISRIEKTNNTYYTLHSKARHKELEHALKMHKKIKELEASNQGYNGFLFRVANGMKKAILKLLR